jgi:hypothetical protein
VPAGSSPFEIYVMDADGSNPTRVTTGSGLKFFPVWSPDGTRIAFNGNLEAEPGDFEVYHVDAVDGSDPVRVTNSPGFDGRCDWLAIPRQAAPAPPAPPAPPPVPPEVPGPTVSACPTEDTPGFLHPAKLRVARAPRGGASACGFSARGAGRGGDQPDR